MQKLKIIRLDGAEIIRAATVSGAIGNIWVSGRFRRCLVRSVRWSGHSLRMEKDGAVQVHCTLQVGGLLQGFGDAGGGGEDFGAVGCHELVGDGAGFSEDRQRAGDVP